MKNLKRSIMKLTLAAMVLAAMTINMPLNVKAASAGALDGSFDLDGKVITNVAGADSGEDVTVQPDGKIVVVGSVSSGGAVDFLVVRYNPDGSLDTTFDTDGKVTTDFGNVDAAFGVAIQSDGKIVVAGVSGPSGAPIGDFAIARYNPNGSLDTTFDTDGKVLTDFAGADAGAVSVAIQIDGKIIAGGSALPNFALARYNTNGSLDTTFDTDGKQTVSGTDIGNDMALQPDGKIVMAGGGFDFVVARLNTNGSLDTTFDTDGIATTNISGNDVARSVVIQTDGTIVAAGSSDGGLKCALARYASNGAFAGSTITDFNTSASDSIRDISLQANGKIVAAVNSGSIFNAMRYTPAGVLDATFGTGGKVSVSVQSSDFVKAMAIVGGEKIVVVGNNNSDISMIRLNVNSQPTAATDFDGDGFGDYVIFRPTTGNWFILRSSDAAVQILSFGSNGDVPLDGDFDGDGRSDMAIYRQSNGEWWFQRSSNNTVHAAQFGAAGDKPIPTDVDKDGKSDFIVWRPSNGNWFVLRSSDGFSSFFSFPLGSNGDVPVGTAIFP